ncbi:hypothetical protein DERF_014443 [Dermatophagoides farinae]|uniref:Uncharacterized protein n=1 Tax=Dermatophagoides farinae TaxID=6954 RepID=A0A922L1A4_DERFA|nr:hypothetical protein DERF_014443 [Dermatophagoides farinae]
MDLQNVDKNVQDVIDNVLNAIVPGSTLPLICSGDNEPPCDRSVIIVICNDFLSSRIAIRTRNTNSFVATLLRPGILRTNSGIDIKTAGTRIVRFTKR